MDSVESATNAKDNLAKATFVEAAVAESAVAAVICAAGTSVRMGGTKKEYCLLPGSNELTVLAATVSAFAAFPEIKDIIITVPAEPVGEKDTAQKALPSRLVEGKSPTIHFVDGGVTRQASVFNALSMISNWQNKQPDFVLIHDGARPWVSTSLIKRIISELKKYHAVIPLLPLTETPKEIDREWRVGSEESNKTMLIKRHHKRALIGGAQTPQGFAFPEIFAAHQQAAENSEHTHHEYTDDAEIWALFCGPVAAIPGDPKNRKITFPEDLC
jgi:2-C-methyl-D-erythritol 4-phosphate cytidylyltransferase/2-C-methyl-D-erythritol 4-phosphate cytidylyltransferase/2-C-methyl-D-erythritol 2,4-cyclodiphosphate synthase